MSEGQVAAAGGIGKGQRIRQVIRQLYESACQQTMQETHFCIILYS